MKREYCVKKFDNSISKGVEARFQDVCNELAEEGWTLQEFHIGMYNLVIAVFYKDME